MLAYHDVVVVTDALYLSLQCSQLIPQLLVLDHDGRGTLKQCRRGHRCDTKLLNVCVCVCVCVCVYVSVGILVTECHDVLKVL